MVLTAVTAASRWLPAGALFLVLAAIHTWSLATGPHLSFQNDDEWLNAWAVAWIAHQIPRDPLHLFDANMFHPRGGALAYTEPLIVPGLMAAPIHWLGGSPLFAHNVLVFAGLTLTALATYWLVRDWTGDRRAGLLASTALGARSSTASAVSPRRISTLPSRRHDSSRPHRRWRGFKTSASGTSSCTWMRSPTRCARFGV